MQDRLKKFFESIGYEDADNNFENAHISKVILIRKKNLLKSLLKMIIQLTLMHH